MTKLSLFSILILAVFNIGLVTDVEPELKKITEFPAKEYSRSYSVLKNSPTVLQGDFIETYKGVQITQGTYYNNLPDGNWIFRGLNNKAERVLSYEKGILNGNSMRFYKTGDTCSVSFYKMGRIEGEQRSFHLNGKPLSSGTFAGGKAVGKFTEWYDNAQIKSIKHYENNKLQGEYQYFSASGILLIEGNYKAGLLDGINREFYPDGKLRLEMEYKNGNCWNLIHQLKKNGKENKKSGKLVNGNGTINLYNNDEALVNTETFSNGLLEGTSTQYYKNGKTESIAEYHAGRRNGLYADYYSSGEIYRKSFYTNDTLNGHEIRYSDNKIFKEGDYKMGEKVPGTWKVYSPNGFSPEEILENTPVKSEELHFPDGDLNAEAFSFAEVMPDFLDGEFQSFLKANTKYPAEAMHNGIQGTCYISFIINKLGFVEDVKVAKGTSPLLDAEALRVMKTLPRWTPGYIGGQPVRIEMKQPVRFVLK
ncbi:MAG: TonB family protein [Bacteroidia bacterium]